MRARWHRLVELARTGFWFMPMLMLGAACGLALLLLYLDLWVDPGIKATLPWAYSGGPEGARSLLSTIAGSMITAASVTFSLASVALSIASQQYGSRVLRNFMRDRITQVLLGTFVATFIYCVLVVRAIRGSDFSGGFVPAISVTVAIALAVVSLVLLIFFIHHVSASIQASHIIRVIAEDMAQAIPNLYPSETGAAPDDLRSLQELRSSTKVPVKVAVSGYLQMVDLGALFETASGRNIVIELLVKPGDHIVAGRELAYVWGVKELPEEELKCIVGVFVIGWERTPEQDIRYQFQQLAEVVIRALSPGINDPFTAINGIDELETALALLARRGRINEKRYGKDGVLRLIVPTTNVSEVLEETVGHIAIYGAGDPFVLAGLRKIVDRMGSMLFEESERVTVRRLREQLDRRQLAKSLG
ncbi:MAG TPA: DUF2254 domain-containing protein [Candidatus Acidoferrum sp.]